MNEEEKKLVEMSRNLWNEFFDLPEYLPSDKEDFVFHIRAIQAIIMQRVAVRVNPDEFTIGEYGGRTNDDQQQKK